MSPSTFREHQGSQPVTQLSAPAHADELQLAAAVNEALRSTGYPYLRALDVSIQDAVVTLRGRVPSFYLKLVAQEATMAVNGVCRLVNDLVVTGGSHVH